MNDRQATATTEASYQTWADEIARLCQHLAALESAAAPLEISGLEQREWYELLNRKLRPQVAGPAVAIVALVGGTNIGKSVIFNHLAGEEASAVSPMAAGTRHPVCLVPENFDAEQRLPELMPGFIVERWQSSDDPLNESEQHHLYWRPGSELPERLLVLDTPDIDSDVEINWQRADRIRQSADVLIAVLTQQKYNDAAVKQYFRRAAESDKEIIVIFNQCDLEEDREYWPQWLATFAEQTGAQPQLVYVVPYDRQAAAQRRLPFYQVGPDGRGKLDKPALLQHDLASLYFDRIKIRTLRGALRQVLDQREGLPAYLREVRHVSSEFAAAVELLSSGEVVKIDWPTLPSHLLVDEIRQWWHERRQGWTRTVHEAYGKVGRAILWPIRQAWGTVRGSEPGDSLEHFHAAERAAIVRVVEERLHELERLSELGNERLRDRLKRLLNGPTREQLLTHIEDEYRKLPPIDDAYRQFIHDELGRWCAENPKRIRFLGLLDKVAAAARPAITVSLTLTGWGLVHEAITNVAIEALVTGGIAGGGEAVVSGGTEGLRLAAARLFDRLQQRFISQRINWLDELFHRLLLGELKDELRLGAELVESDAFRQTEAAMGRLAELLKHG